MELSNLEQIFGALNDAQVNYLVVGGLAVIAHGYVRYTNDLDLVLALDEANVRRAMEALKLLGYKAKVPVDPVEFANPLTRASWVRDKQMVVFQLVSERFKREPIDVFVREPFDVTNELLACEWLAVGPTLKIPVVSKRVLLAMKREASRPKDLLDIEYLEKLKGLTGE
ncbi:MAG: nucleotidyl transferase AbiEii/AbiGii toxin family protein [Verrucomicrobia bacterium]|nr:nucleotidyl transferase AbiEii/AbiGii toxin family protein [Verrucomicrobiota bacterium]